MKLFFIIFFSSILYSDIEIDYNKELYLLESFDIEPSFIYDKKMNDILFENSSIYKNNFFQAVDRSYLFFPIIKDILSKKNIPKEFIYLAMVESHFSALTISNKEAVGIWQFIPETAEDYHLKIDKYVDERKDIIKSTRAAANFLNRLYVRFGKWYLAIIAYNCGGGRLQKAINSAGSDDLDILLDEKKAYIPKESQRYIRKVVAYTLMANNEYFLSKREYEHFLNIGNTYSISTINLPSGESLKRVSEVIDFSFEKLKKLNRHLNYEFIPPYTQRYDIYIPYKKLSEFKQKYFEIVNRYRYKIHIVKKGDNLKMLSKLYKISYMELVNKNKLLNSELTVNQKLIIPIN